MPRTILITGATGSISSGIIPQLRKSDIKVRALVRGAASAKGLEGVEIVEGDLERPRTLPRVFEGVDIAWLLSPPGPRAPEQQSNAIWAARQAGVRKAVRSSAIGAAHDAPTINGRLHALSDEELSKSGMEWTILKPLGFMQNLFGSAPQIAEGVLYSGTGDSRQGMIDVRDISEVAARVLTTEGHGGRTYTLSGPRSISYGDIAASFSRALGKPVKYVPLPADAVEEALAKQGLDEWRINFLGDYMNAYARGWGDFVTDDVQTLLGKPARSIDDFAHDFASVFTRK